MEVPWILFLQNWLQASVKAQEPSALSLLEDADWNRVVRVAESWKLIPLLNRSIAAREGFVKVPDSARLRLNERIARAKVLEAALARELDVILARASDEAIEVLLLGQSAFTLQYRYPAVSDECAIALAVQDLHGALRAFARQGYRGSGEYHQARVRLHHRNSPTELLLVGELNDQAWRRSTRDTLRQKPVRRANLIDLAAWVRTELARNTNPKAVPKLLVELSLVDPVARELNLLDTIKNFEQWTQGESLKSAAESPPFSQRLAQIALSFLLSSHASEQPGNPAQNQESQDDHGEHAENR